EGTLDRNSRNFVIQSDLQIAPGWGGIPLSGDIGLSYRDRGNVLELAHSHFDFPSSHLSVAGTVGANLQVIFDSTNLDDVQPALSLTEVKSRVALPPFTLNKGSL